MSSLLNHWDDTIAALATPPGIGAIGVIRVSGPQSFQAVQALFPSKDLSAQPSHTLLVGNMRKEGEVLDEVVLALFRGPRSYTGEDVIEISCHGSPFVQEKILQALLAEGLRLAKPGEFTQRAFLNGKLDLAQAEAVADLIASNTEASRRAALHNLRGGFSADLQRLREELIRFSALIELELDFSQEDVAFADRDALRSLIQQLAQTTQQLLQSFRLGNAIRHGVQVAIIGKPNAGKSTLLNALLNENRAIVSEMAGTTRDTIEEVLNIGGILFRLIDTAGIREHTQDQVEQIGVARSLEKMRAADIVIYLFDILNLAPAELQAIQKDMDAQQIRYLLVGNKAEADSQAIQEQFAAIPGILFISAKEGWQLEQLKDALLAQVRQGEVNPESSIVTNARHFEALERLYQSLAEVAAGLDSGLTGDLLALDIRQCLHWLGSITGQITHEDQLDYIFSKFCIGK
ncbi:MAG TPA: tRNA uridine-5-carboxymethylaminomethyl(34) synthesis GTPase MnmE [Sediminibacterium sp.]|nr:tRNA uridine-5-carboxymethylaminomethyl(34) synthesis GTPase MnmE [Sediminibacterium sp.]